MRMGGERTPKTYLIVSLIRERKEVETQRFQVIERKKRTERNLKQKDAQNKICVRVEMRMAGAAIGTHAKKIKTNMR